METQAKGRDTEGLCSMRLSWSLCGAPVSCSPATSISSPLSGSLSFACICLYPIHLLRLAYQVSHLWGRADLSSSTFRLKAPRLVREPRSRGQRCRKERRRRAQHSRAGCRKVSEEGLISSAERGSSLGKAGCEVWVHLALASPACSATGPSDTLLFSLSHFSHL